MRADIRETHEFQEARALHELLRQPGAGRLSDAAELHAAADGKSAVFVGTVVSDLEGQFVSQICAIDLESGDIRVLSSGSNIDRSPKFSPDGKHVAFLSDRHQGGDFQLYLFDMESGIVRCTPRVDGWVEYIQWSSNGEAILLGVAGHGADISSGQGAITSKRTAAAKTSWMPAVQTGDEECEWRRAWVYDVDGHQVRRVPAEGNIWEAAWCGVGSIAAVVSPGPSEGLWYTSRLHILDAHTGQNREIYHPNSQLGLPAASPSGRRLAIVEAICSDRLIVAGDVHVADTHSGAILRIDTQGVDVTYLDWRSEEVVLLAGHRGFDTVVGLYDIVGNRYTPIWCSRDVTTSGRYATVSGFGAAGDCVLVGEGFNKAPEIAVIRQGQYRPVRSFDLMPDHESSPLGEVQCVRWKAPDGLSIEGWLLLPKGKGPHPIVMNIHGGPVLHWRPAWLGRSGALFFLLLKRSYAIFLPNPRGSSGRGQLFVKHILGDMGGADTYDYLSGLDHLIEQGIADPRRLGLTGISYGGFMTSWLVTQDSRFSAAVSVAPVTNQVTEHLLSNIPHFVKMFLADSYANLAGKYYQRSPITHAHNARTPTLNICGALDRCTPAEEAAQFHNALLENEVESALVTYPEEGHGIRKFPAVVDYVARTVAWFEKHMPIKERGH